MRIGNQLYEIEILLIHYTYINFISDHFNDGIK